jgi:hypothetical protein
VARTGWSRPTPSTPPGGLSLDGHYQRCDRYRQGTLPLTRPIRSDAGVGMPRRSSFRPWLTGIGAARGATSAKGCWRRRAPLAPALSGAIRSAGAVGHQDASRRTRAETWADGWTLGRPFGRSRWTRASWCGRGRGQADGAGFLDHGQCPSRRTAMDTRVDPGTVARPGLPGWRASVRRRGRVRARPGRREGPPGWSRSWSPSDPALGGQASAPGLPGPGRRSLPGAGALAVVGALADHPGAQLRGAPAVLGGQLDRDPVAQGGLLLGAAHPGRQLSRAGRPDLEGGGGIEHQERPVLPLLSACLNARYGLWTNGDEQYCLAKQSDRGALTFEEIMNRHPRGRAVLGRGPAAQAQRPQAHDRGHPAVRLPPLPQLHRRHRGQAEGGGVLEASQAHLLQDRGRAIPVAGLLRHRDRAGQRHRRGRC